MLFLVSNDSYTVYDWYMTYGLTVTMDLLGFLATPEKDFLVKKVLFCIVEIKFYSIAAASRTK